MMFDDDEILANEEILFEGKPSFLFFCKNVIIGFILIAFILGSAMTVISSISNLQTYSLSFINRPMAGIVAIIIYGVIFIILLWMIWDLIKWYNIDYIVTDRRIITKKGIVRQKKSYISFKNIQDINVSQTILQKILGVGTIEVMSAYDNGDVLLKYVRAPKELEEIIFNGMNALPDPFNQDYPRNNYYQNQNYNPYNSTRYDNNPTYPQNNIKEEYLRENYPDYNPEEEYKKGRYYDSLSKLSDEPLDSYNDNEIYYNDYRDPDEFDETINQAVRDLDGNVMFKNDEYLDPRASQRNNITYQGHSIEGQYDKILNNENLNRTSDYEGNYPQNNQNFNRNDSLNPNYQRNNNRYPDNQSLNLNSNRGYSNYPNNQNIENPRNYQNFKEDNINYHNYPQNNNYNPNYGENPQYHNYREEANYRENNNYYRQDRRDNSSYRNSHHNNHKTHKNNSYEEEKNHQVKHSKGEKTSEDVLEKHARKFRKN